MIAPAASDAVVGGDQVQHVQVLPLVLVQPLHLHVEQRLRIHGDPGALPDERGEAILVGGLDRVPVRLETGVGGERLDADELRLQIRHPALADRAREERGQARIAQRDPSPRRDAVGHVAELLRRHPVEIAEHGLLQQVAVQRRDAVDGMAAGAGEVRHPDEAAAALVYQRQPAKQVVVAGYLLPHLSRNRRLMS